MSVFLYSLGLWFYEQIAWATGIINPKAKEFIAGRKNSLKDLIIELATNSAPLLWVHCSSVGEYEQGRPVLELFKNKHPEFKILATFYSPSGYNAVKRDTIIDFTAYLPRDSSGNARKLLDIIDPKLALFIKYEFWHFYLSELRSRKIPVFSVSSIFREDQIYFKGYGGFYRRILNKFSYFFVQDIASSEMLKKLNIDSIVTGDTRIDRVISIKKSAKPIEKIDFFLNENETFVVGSLRKEDLDLIIEFVGDHPELNFIIAPHEITESMIQPLEKSLSCIRYSNLDENQERSQVLIIDNIGMLSRLYRHANYCYVGGGFSDGLHNILEPAVYEIPIFFGNKDYQRFKEAIDLIDRGAAFPIGSIKELETVFKHLQGDKNQQETIKNALSNYLKVNKGGAARINTYLNQALS